jgi:myo-inositol-1(or 4)-monophosphatase
LTSGESWRNPIPTKMPRSEITSILTSIAREAGDILLRFHGKVRRVWQKGHISSVVCEADLAAEKTIVRRLLASFPSYGVLSEESGVVRQGAEMTWVIDPLDGTSNFVAGLPWYGVQFGLLRHGRPLAAVMYLPADNVLYLSEKGAGVERNGERVFVSRETQLKRVLCAFGFDGTASPANNRTQAAMLMRLAAAVRNTRATNSLVDFCYTVDGRFGGCLNMNCKIWDIVPVSLMLPEAGGKLTDLRGEPIVFDLGERRFGRSYRVIGAPVTLHSRLLRRIRCPQPHSAR